MLRKRPQWSRKRAGKIVSLLLALFLVCSLAVLALPPYLEVDDLGYTGADVPIPPDGADVLVQQISLTDDDTDGTPVHITKFDIEFVGTGADASDIDSVRIYGGIYDSGFVAVSLFPIDVQSGLLTVPDGGSITLSVEVRASDTAAHGEVLQLKTWMQYWEDWEDNTIWDSAIDGATEMLVDVTPPTNPALASSSHATGVWSNDPNVTITATGASDAASGVDGFEVEWDQSSTCTPSETKSEEEGWSGDSYTATSDGDWYLHVATVDNAGNWTSTTEIGPFKIDTTVPNVPSDRNPADGTITNIASPTLSWSEPGDPGGSGVKSYRIYVDDEPSFSSPRVKEATVYDLDYSPSLYDGVFYWKLYAKDNAGNAGDWSDVWSIIIDTTSPTVTAPSPVTLECSCDLPPAAETITQFLALPDADASDNYSLQDNLAVSSTTGGLVGTECDGTITRTYTITDEAGNSTSVDRVFNVSDDTSPTWDQTPPEDVLALEDDLPVPPTLTASDNCDTDVDVTYVQIGAPSGSSYTLERKWTATDDCDNSTVHSEGVSVVVIPDDVTVECGESTDPSNTGSIDELHNDFISTEVEYSDDTTGLTGCGGTGQIIRTWAVTDEDGFGSKSVTGEQTITIEDTTSPSITTQASDLTVECDGAGNTAELNAWLAAHGGAVASDVCCGTDVTWSHNYTALSDDCGATGSAMVTFTATDCCGNASTTSATFTIIDTTPPSITTQASDLTVECDGAGNTTELNAWLASHGGAVASDVCCGTDVTWTNDFIALSDDCGATGSATVTFTATDCCDNTATTQATITIVDTTPPSITTQASDLTVECDGAGNTTELNAWLAVHGGAVASDVCCGTDVTWTNDFTALSDECGTSGSATVTFTATDCCGLTSTTQATFTIIDTTPPSITTQASDLTVECDGAGNTTELNAWLAVHGGAVASDVCCGTDVTWTNDFTALSDECGTSGSATVTFTATDCCGLTSTTQATFTIIDTTPPTFDSPPEDVLVLEEDIPTPPTLTASDNCDDNVEVVYAQIGGATGNSYTLERKWTATDECGNSTVHSQGVSVVVIPDDVTVECGESTDPSNTGTIDELDDKFIDTVVEYEDSEDGTCPTVITRTWTVADEADVLDPVSGDQIITVEDTTRPEITCPDALTLECDPATNADDIDAWLASATASDTCGEVTISNDYEGLGGGCSDTTGSAMVTFTATDECDNESTCQATVTVVDTTPPEITCPEDVTLECPVNTTPASTGTATGSDACGDVTITYSDAVTESCGNTKTIVRTWTAEDECGLSTSCDQTITVVDTTPPEITCPEDVTVSCDAGTCEATGVELGIAAAMDNCDSDPTLSNDAPGVFPLGETVVTWTATDACGNGSVCTQLVTVIDQEAPTVAFTQVPPEVSSDASPHFEWTGSDNCTASEDMLFSTQLDGGVWSDFSHATNADIGPLEDGDHTFQVRATDAAGRSGTSEVDTFTIASERPVVAITSPESRLVTGTSELEVTYTISGTDLSSAEFLHNGTATAIAPADGSITITLTPGENTLEVMATNIAGTSSSGTVTVTYDIIPPVVVITTPLDDQVLGVNACTVTGTVDDPDVSEVTLLVNGIGETVGVTAGAFIRELTGLTDGETYEIEAQASDAVGNTGSSGVVTIRVNVSQPVVAITSPPSGFVTGTSELEVTYVIGGADLSSATFLHNGAATAIAPANGSITITLVPGDNALEVRATNIAGTSSSGTVTVTYDIIPPVVVITTPLDGQVLGVNACTVTGTVDDPDVSEVMLLVNGVAEIISLASPFTKDLTGLTDGATYEIEARATDAAGNTGSSGIVTIRVNTSQPVVAITSPPSGTVTGTSELEVTYEISGVDLSSAEFLHNGAAILIAPADGSITITLTPGENSLEVTATNVAGTSSSGVRSVTYDTVPPVVEITSPADGTLVTVPSVQVTGTIDDPEVSYVDLIVNGEAAAVISVVAGSFNNTITLEQEGLSSIEVRATDASGNTGSSGTIGVDYDPGKPDVKVKHPTSGYVTKLDACAVDGTVTHGAAITDATLYVNGVAGALSLTLESAEGGQYLYTFNTTITLVEGENSLAVETTDEFGKSGSSGTIPVTLDTTAPLVAITAPVTGYLTNQEMVLVTGTVDDPAVSQIVLNVNGTEKTIAVAAGSFSKEVSLVEGENTLEATASDSLGNEGSSGAVVVTYDSAAPAVSITSPATGTKTNSASMVVTYTIAPEATSAEFILNGVSEAITPESGSRSVSLVEGDNTLEVRASDGVNVGSSGVVRVILDGTAPSVTVELSEPAETILITVHSNEALASPPTVEVTNGATTEVEMTLTGVREWTGSYSIPEDGSYVVEVSGTDEAGNGGSYSTSFSRESVSAGAGETINVETDQLRLDIEVGEAVSDQSFATAVYTKDPRSGVEPKAAIFVKVDMGIALQRAIVEMTIKAFYDPAKLPEGADESTLKLYLWTPSKGGWSLVEGATVDTTEHSITGVVTY